MSQLIVSSAQAAASGLGRAVASGVANAAASFAMTNAENILFGPVKRRHTGPRIESFQLQASTQGAGIAQIFGQLRLAGQLIWASNFLETNNTTTSRQGGKASRTTETTTTDFVYSISFAVALCEGVIDRIGTVWADGHPIDLSKYETRLYRGTEDQLPDPLVEQIEGGAPAYRGLAYIVFEDLPLAEFGNRIPQLKFEIERGLLSDDPTHLENAIQAVTLIPGSGEFIYGTTPVQRLPEEGVSLPENTHGQADISDIETSLDHLQQSLPNLTSVSLVVSWFGTDLRAGDCEIKPGVERREKLTTPDLWAVENLTRDTAHLISTRDGHAAYGGTPSDKTVIEAIQEIKSRGLKVTFYPFILMDVTAAQNLPAPNGGVQGDYPWRGRIAPLTDAGLEIPTFFEREFGLRRMVLHYAQLCQQAGGVDSFLLASELRGVTTATSGGGVFPAIQKLQTLAQDVRAIVGPQTALSYAADWSEYFGYQPSDGSGDVWFHLDPLWADPVIDFVAIDNYLPLSDWRETGPNLDQATYSSVYDPAYLQSNIQGGEYYDWYYASDANRTAQQRSTISDGAYNEPWIYRPKDFWNWWTSPHHQRPGGGRAQLPTAWQSEMKPIRFTELGCGAVHLGANQPNKFSDPKSSEDGAPWFSDGSRDDLMQRVFLEAHLSYWSDPANNPISSVYGGPMVATDEVAIYTWDARPWPDFPARIDIWSDGDNWLTGHWLNGRVGRVTLAALIRKLTDQAEGILVDAQKNHWSGLGLCDFRCDDDT